MKLEPFEMERMQSTWENIVELNLSESGVYPMSLHELLADDPETLNGLLHAGLGYIQSNGTIPLREKIAALYKNATLGSRAGHDRDLGGQSPQHLGHVWSRETT